jgi:hypothetical protein
MRLRKLVARSAAARTAVVAFWRKGDTRFRVGLGFNVSGRWASEHDVALPVGQRFNVMRRRSCGPGRIW